jgi:membrane fusion protein, multidrug efflux system
MKKLFAPISLVGIFCFFAALAGLMVLSSPSLAEEKKAPPMLVEAAVVKKAASGKEITAVGTVRADEAVNIATEIAGRIASINFSEGGRVAKGEVLLRLDAAISEAQRDEAQANLTLSAANYQRAEALLKEQAISAQEVDAARAQYLLHQAQLRLRNAELAKSVIVAPFAGIVGLRQVSPGSYVQPGTLIVTLAALDPVKVDFRLPESYANTIKIGQSLTLSVAALGSESLTGTVYAIDPQIDEKGRSLLLRARVANPAGLLRPGMFATVRLSAGTVGETLVIPEEAIVLQSSGQKVYRVVAGKVELVAVTTGKRRQGEVEILTGLQAGDTVVTAGQLKIRPGTEVKIATPQP